MTNKVLIILLFIFSAPLTSWCQTDDALFFTGGTESPHHIYYTSWVCTGDTMRCDTTERYGVIHLIDGFWIMQIEVTLDLWRWYMNYDNSASYVPVTGISKPQVDTFCHLISISTNSKWRLPTKEEWSFAYHGGLFSEGYAYSGSNTHSFVAWSKDNSRGRIHPGGERLSNELDLYDMAGNAAEMVTDGDSIVFVGGSFIDTMSPNVIPTQSAPPPETCGFRLVFRDPQWIDSFGNRVFPQ